MLHAENPRVDSALTARRVLARAAVLAGGVPGLAGRLDVPVFEMTRWMEGEAKPPPEVYAAALKIADGEAKA